MRKTKSIEFYIDENECFICTSHNSNGNGYGKILINGVRKSIHRHIYEECFGELDSEEFVRHVCNNTRCINPNHMFIEKNGTAFSKLNKKRSKGINFEIDNNGCFICTSHAFSHNGGYAKISINGKRKYVHRHIYEECFGTIDDGLVVRHKCDNNKCINPEHLELGTQRDNLQDTMDRNKNFNIAKLTVKEVKEIKIELRDGEGISVLAKRYGVSNQSIRAIRDGKTWRNVTI